MTPTEREAKIERQRQRRADEADGIVADGNRKLAPHALVTWANENPTEWKGNSTAVDRLRHISSDGLTIDKLYNFCDCIDRPEVPVLLYPTIDRPAMSPQTRLRLDRAASLLYVVWWTSQDGELQDIPLWHELPEDDLTGERPHESKSFWIDAMLKTMTGEFDAAVWPGPSLSNHRPDDPASQG